MLDNKRWSRWMSWGAVAAGLVLAVLCACTALTGCKKLDIPTIQK